MLKTSERDNVQLITIRKKKVRNDIISLIKLVIKYYINNDKSFKNVCAHSITSSEIIFVLNYSKQLNCIVSRFLYMRKDLK